MSRYLHTMLRVGDLDRSVGFYSKAFGMKELRRRDVPDGKYTLSFVGYGDEDSNTAIELTYNYGVEKYEMGGAFGHLAIGVPDVAAACDIAAKAGGTDHPSGGAGEVRHHDHRVRQGSGRLHDRTGAAAVVFGRGGRKTWKPASRPDDHPRHRPPPHRLRHSSTASLARPRFNETEPLTYAASLGARLAEGCNCEGCGSCVLTRCG